MGPSGTLVKGQGFPELISDYGAKRSICKAMVHWDRKVLHPMQTYLPTYLPFHSLPLTAFTISSCNLQVACLVVRFFLNSNYFSTKIKKCPCSLLVITFSKTFGNEVHKGTGQ
jgi:hypothetical protein